MSECNILIKDVTRKSHHTTSENDTSPLYMTSLSVGFPDIFAAKSGMCDINHYVHDGQVAFRLNFIIAAYLAH